MIIKTRIAGFIGWHPSFNDGQANASFICCFEEQQQKRINLSNRLSHRGISPFYEHLCAVSKRLTI